MGYGLNDAGKFLKNFGPLSKAGGSRRLNVAVTRAREQMILVASVMPAHMDLSGSTSEGAHLLKSYLEYADRGVDALATTNTITTQECDSPFEEEVAEALIRRGFAPVSQVGCGGFRIDLALKHPERPGEFCLGIECDGATYHSSRTARDRDRIRQSVLEDLGWNIVRVWSTDWIRNPVKQIQRIVDAYDRVISAAGNDLNPTEEAEFHDEDLQPQIVEQVVAMVRKFSSIDEVPDQSICEAASVVLGRSGTTDWDDLVVYISRELGFSRTGQKILARIEFVLQQELHAKRLHRIGDRVGNALDD